LNFELGRILNIQGGKMVKMKKRQKNLKNIFKGEARILKEERK